jgi:hypothetical protein
MRMGRFFVFAILLATGVYISTVLASPQGAAEPRKAVVVELFTSEGCSSCPPADALLGHLRQDLAGKNIQVIPLGFHVDYWNSLGWKDRFSSAEFSHRQEQYARSLGVDGPYTPQIVVDGALEFVGSDAGQAQRAISRAASQPATAEVKISTSAGDQLTVQVKAPVSANGASVMMAITEDNLSTKVGGGENGGRELHHAAVVRDLRLLGRLQNGSFESSAPSNLAKDWKREDLQVVVFVQEASSGKILGAGSVALMGQPR